MRSLSLYASLGFDVKEPVAVVSGRPRDAESAETELHPFEDADLDECAALCEQVHGFERRNDLRDAAQASKAFVARRDGRITGYLSNITFWPMNHGIAEGDEDMKALIRGAASAVEEPLAFLVPLRSPLLRWCLEQSLRLVKPMNLMTVGEYREPAGSWLPSVLY